MKLRRSRGAGRQVGRAKKPRRGGANEDIFVGDDDPFFEDEDEPSPAANGGAESEEEEEETADQKRVRIAKEVVSQVRQAIEAEAADGEEVDDEAVGRELQRREMQDSGRARISLSERVLPSESCDDFRMLVKHHSSVTAVDLSKDDAMGFSASKDGEIMHWDVETGKREKYLWPSEDVLTSHYAKALHKSSRKRSKCVLAIAASSDGRYLATGGLDCHVHLWDVRTREHLQAFPGHKRSVSCLAFRLDSPDLFSGGADNVINLWNVEDRAHVESLFGHQNEILTADCLGKERVLTVARDKTMRLWKIPEATHLRFLSPTSTLLESCCFVSDNEFLSGFDDGSIGLWSITRRKPTHVVKNAHPCSSEDHGVNDSINGATLTENGNCKPVSENGNCKPDKSSVKSWKPDGALSAKSWVCSVAVCRGSDLAASGAANGAVRLWAIESGSRGIRPLFSYSLDGYVNSLAFAKYGRFLVAGVGKEHRLGRWSNVRTAQNGVAIHPIQLKEETR